MEINDTWDMPKEVAEKVLKSVMEPLKAFIDDPLSGTESIEAKDITKEQAKTMYDRLGAIAMGLAHQYSNEAKYQTSLNTMARENVRLTDTIMVLSEQLSNANKMLEEAATHIAQRIEEESRISSEI